MQKKELTKSLRYMFGIGDFCFNTMTNIETYYFAFFLTNVAGFDAVQMGIITSIGGTVDACLSWIYGAIMNSVKPMKHGRYRSWMILLTWIVPIFYAMEFFPFGTTSLAVVLCLIGYIGSKILWNFGYVANVALIPVVAHTPEDRVALSSMRGTWNNVASCLVAFTVTALTGVYAKFAPNHAYAMIAFTWALLTAIGFLIHFKLTAGYELTGAEEMAKPKEKQTEKTSIGDLLKALFTNLPLCALLIADLARWFFKFVTGMSAAYYFTYVAKNVAVMSVYLTVANLLGVCGAYLSRYIANKFSARNASIIIYVVMAIVLFLAKFTYASVGVTVVIVYMSIAQFGYGCVYSLMSALYADAVVYAHWKTGKNPSGWVMGIQNVPLKIGAMVRGAVVAAGLAGTGFKGGMAIADTTPAMMNGITNTFMMIPGIMMIAGAVVLLLGYRLKKSQIVEYQAEIDARENA